MPADDSYLAQTRDHGLLEEWTLIARVRAVLLLAPDNPRGITTWTDLHSGGVRVAVPNDGAALGKQTRDHLTTTGHWTAVRPQVTDVLTVTDAANAARLGSVDAAVVWDAVAAGPGYRGQQVLAVPELDGVRGRVAVGVLKQSPDAAAARAFVDYLAGRGFERFREAGFEVAP
jgi:ABC-type molybdate transport system substrate-binding protein